MFNLTPKLRPCACLVAISLAMCGSRRALAEERASFVPEGYRLAWSDEFDGDHLNMDAWVHRTTQRGQTSICLPENVSLADGKLRIACRREPDRKVQLTCGGAITRQPFRYGYYEVAVRMHGGVGWHEAFWTTIGTDFSKMTPELEKIPRIEIDCFESYADHGLHKFTYGVIEWHPIHGGVSRGYHETPINLAESFNVFGFEFTPEFVNFYFNGELLETTDAREIPRNPFHLWLSCIATKDTPDVQDGYCEFDYLRCYAPELDSVAYKQHREQFLEKLNRANPPMQGSHGTDLWIEAEDFQQLGNWTQTRDRGPRILKGAGDRKPDATWTSRAARTMVDVPRADTYRLWVCTRDYADRQPRSRTFQVAVNGKVSDHTFGTHGEEGYRWEDGGLFELPAGLATLELIDSKRYHARCDRLLLTSDREYQPRGLGFAQATQQTWFEGQAKSAGATSGK